MSDKEKDQLLLILVEENRQLREQVRKLEITLRWADARIDELSEEDKK